MILSPPKCTHSVRHDALTVHCNEIMQTWYIQIHDKDGNVLLMNGVVGEYKKYNAWVQKAADRIADGYSDVKRYEVRPNPYTHKVIL